MKFAHNQSGSLLLEAVLAMALFTIFVTAVASLAITANQGTGNALIRQKAVWRLQEGIEALQTVSFEDLSVTDLGRITWNGTSWFFSADGPADLGEQVTRAIRVQEVRRGPDCVIVSVGGAVDPDTLGLESEVFWTDALGRSKSAVFATLRTRYDDPQGSCFLAEEASQVTINLTLEAEWFGLKQLRTLFIENTSSNPVTITEMTFTWDNEETVSQNFIDATKVWANGGPGLPAGHQPSGTLLDIEDYTILANTTVEINKVQFSDDMRGTTVTLKLKFLDGSEITSDPFIPTW